MKSMKIRRYEAKDKNALEDVCKNVYGGTDYLPSMASQYLLDPKCSFMVLCDESGEHVIGCANLRFLDSETRFLEAVRISEAFRNKGLAQYLIGCMLREEFRQCKTVYSCTVKSNEMMQRIFKKLEMDQVGKLYISDFKALQSIPGWSADDPNPPQACSLVEAYELERVIPEAAREAVWSKIESRKQIEDILKKIKSRGGCGRFPGLNEISSIDILDESRIFFLQRGIAIMGLIEDPRLQSLKSKWVLAVCASNEIEVQSAIWYASTSETFGSLYKSHRMSVLVFEMPGSLSNAFAEALRLSNNICLIYKKDFI